MRIVQALQAMRDHFLSSQAGVNESDRMQMAQLSCLSLGIGETSVCKDNETV